MHVIYLSLSYLNITAPVPGGGAVQVRGTSPLKSRLVCVAAVCRYTHNMLTLLQMMLYACMYICMYHSHTLLSHTAW